jgi:hypothetical protein
MKIASIRFELLAIFPQVKNHQAFATSAGNVKNSPPQIHRFSAVGHERHRTISSSSLDSVLIPIR